MIRRSPSPSVAPPGLFRIPTSYPGFPSVTRGYSPSPFQGSLASPSGNPVKPRPSKNPPAERRLDLDAIKPGATSRRGELPIDRCRNLLPIEPGPGGAAENSPGQAKRARGSRSTSTRSPGRATEIICPHYPVSPIRPNSMRYHACQTQLTHTWQLPRT
jgi:hypothetical protein